MTLLNNAAEPDFHQIIKSTLNIQAFRLIPDSEIGFVF
jgi:hypothetical protein